MFFTDRRDSHALHWAAAAPRRGASASWTTASRTRLDLGGSPGAVALRTTDADALHLTGVSYVTDLLPQAGSPEHRPLLSTRPCTVHSGVPDPWPAPRAPPCDVTGVRRFPRCENLHALLAPSKPLQREQTASRADRGSSLLVEPSGRRWTLVVLFKYGANMGCQAAAARSAGTDPSQRVFKGLRWRPSWWQASPAGELQ